MNNNWINRGGVVALLTICLLPTTVFGWMAVDTINCRNVEIFYPEKPSDIPAQSEIHYSIEGGEYKLGETTGWLKRCVGKCCERKDHRIFEMNTFSDEGLIYIQPLEDY
jgi:hypothetical protein